MVNRNSKSYRQENQNRELKDAITVSAGYKNNRWYISMALSLQMPPLVVSPLVNIKILIRSAIKFHAINSVPAESERRPTVSAALVTSGNWQSCHTKTSEFIDFSLLWPIIVPSLNRKAPPLFMPGKEQSAIKSCALSSQLYINSRATLQEDHFPIIPQSLRPLRCTLMEQMDWQLAPGTPHTLYFLYLSPRLLITLPSLPWLPVSISPVFSIAAGLSINHLSYHCDVLRPHWRSLCYDLASSWFRAEWYFVCQCLRQPHTIRTQRVFQPALNFLLSFHAREWN